MADRQKNANLWHSANYSGNLPRPVLQKSRLMLLSREQQSSLTWKKIAVAKIQLAPEEWKKIKGIA